MEEWRLIHAAAKASSGPLRSLVDLVDRPLQALKAALLIHDAAVQESLRRALHLASEANAAWARAIPRIPEGATLPLLQELAFRDAWNTAAHVLSLHGHALPELPADGEAIEDLEEQWAEARAEVQSNGILAHRLFSIANAPLRPKLSSAAPCRRRGTCAPLAATANATADAEWNWVVGAAEEVKGDVLKEEDIDKAAQASMQHRPARDGIDPAVEKHVAPQAVAPPEAAPWAVILPGAVLPLRAQH